MLRRIYWNTIKVYTAHFQCSDSNIALLYYSIPTRFCLQFHYKFYLYTYALMSNNVLYCIPLHLLRYKTKYLTHIVFRLQGGPVNRTDNTFKTFILSCGIYISTYFLRFFFVKKSLKIPTPKNMG